MPAGFTRFISKSPTTPIAMLTANKIKVGQRAARADPAGPVATPNAREPNTNGTTTKKRAGKHLPKRIKNFNGQPEDGFGQAGFEHTRRAIPNQPITRP
jgi:hypothetical protein